MEKPSKATYINDSRPRNQDRSCKKSWQSDKVFDRNRERQTDT